MTKVQDEDAVRRETQLAQPQMSQHTTYTHHHKVVDAYPTYSRQQYANDIGHRQNNIEKASRQF